MAGEDVGRKSEEDTRCACPFCEGAIEMSAPWCEACGVQVRFCVVCEEPLPKDATTCSACGAECEE